MVNNRWADQVLHKGFSKLIKIFRIFTFSEKRNSLNWFALSEGVVKKSSKMVFQILKNFEHFWKSWYFSFFANALFEIGHFQNLQKSKYTDTCNFFSRNAFLVNTKLSCIHICIAYCCCYNKSYHSYEDANKSKAYIYVLSWVLWPHAEINLFNRFQFRSFCQET